MKLANLMNKDMLKGSFKAIGMKIMAAKPEIMLIVGGISVLAGTIYACTKTEDSKKIVKETKEQLIEANAEEIELIEDEELAKRAKIEKGKKLFGIYSHTAYEFLKVYGIPALLWFGGMGMIFGAHGELRKNNAHLIADSVAAKKLFDEYRARVAQAVGEEAENKIFMGAQEGMVTIIETDPETGEEKVSEQKADIFYAQPGSIFARNFTETTSDAFDIRSYAEYYLDARIDAINKDLELGILRAETGLNILRRLGFNENALGDDDSIDKLMHYGISGNARKVTDPEMRKLKVTRLRGYEKKWDAVRNIEVYTPCLRLDFNFYPLEGKI